MEAISVVIITYNEERNIRRCLDSVRDISDDIVVVDSFSTDRTEEICREYGVRFFQRAFDGYIEQKNYADSLTANDWILSVDADECLSEKLCDSIRATQKNFRCDAYIMNRMTCYCGKWIRHGDWYPDRKLRLWKKTKGKWGGFKIHEKVELDADACTGYLKGDLLHYSYYTVSDHVSQANRFTDVMAESRYMKGKKAGFSRILLRPFWKFIKSFVIRLGFLDGHYGFVISIISSHATFLTYVKLRQLRKMNSISRVH
ncbi:MAG: glycosyltransferase family 2 protein [Bacteroidetes bacterium]|nr:glycosyltransferase family 2 protein [Bacteroidota bacterium]